MKGKLIVTVICLAFALLLLGSGLVFAQYPDPKKIITIIAPFAPGGHSDGQIRAIAPHLSRHLGGTRIYVENIVGAGGKLAYERAYKAPPDGYTIMLYNLPAPITTEMQHEAPNYKTIDFVPIYGISVVQHILVVHADNWKTLDEFVLEGQKRVMNIAATGNVTASYFQAVAFVETTKIKGNVIPFEGGAESIAALAGKHIDAADTSYQSASSLIRAGKLRTLVLFSEEPYSGYPGVLLSKDTKWDIPTLPLTAAFVGPPGLSADKVKVLEKAFAASVKEPPFVEWAGRVGMDITPMNSEKVEAITRKAYENVRKFFRK